MRVNTDSLFRIFLSSPGDCTEERAAVHEIALKLNSDPIVNSFAQVDVVAWDWGVGVPLEALASPQVSVNNHLALPEDCDLFVGIFRCKFGTRLPAREFRKNDGAPFLSGSEYEFHRAWDARRRGAAHPKILIYRWENPDDSDCPKNQQVENLKTFFNRPPFKEDGQWIGSLNRYSSPANFAIKLEGHLRELLSQHQPGAEQPIEDWLKRQASILTANAGPRYTNNAHVETNIGQVFDWLLARQAAIEALDKSLSEVWKEIDRDAAFADTRQSMERIAENLRNDAYWQTTPNFAFILDTLARIEKKAWAEHEAHEKADENTSKTDGWRHREYRLRQSAYYARGATDLLNQYAQITGKRILLLTGPAGQGKTHTLVHEINHTLETGGIAIGVLGQTLNSSGDLWAAIRSKLDWQRTVSQLLDKLENEAANKKQRALIVIDALNETPDRRRWRTELLGMVQEVLQRPHLALVISVRADYLTHVLPTIPEGEEKPWLQWEHPGFAGIEPDALTHYFEFFGVKAPVAPPLGEFSNPLYVQLLAKSLKGRQFNHWLPSWLEVWEAWMERLEQEAIDKSILSDTSRSLPLRRTMNKLAQAMLDEGIFTLPRQRADEIARQTTGVDQVIGFLCSAGALIDRPDGEEDEIVEFGFERLSDTFLADRLLTNLFKDIASKEEKHTALSAAFAAGGALHPLASARWIDHPLYYRRAGLLEALCLAAPQHIGAELPSLIPENSEHSEYPDWELNNAFSDSLRWRSKPEEFGADLKTLLELWQERSGQHELDELIRFALIPGHPFAIERIIHPLLLEQYSPGAWDAIWSIKLVSLWPDKTSTLHQLVIWARDAQLHGVQEEIALPAAQLLAWTCATSNNPLRLAAIKGLTRLLTACPAILDKFLPDFLNINDAYILEAVLVAVWGVMLDGSDPEAAGWAAQQVYASQFPDGNARWGHIALRHYARRIVEEAHRRGWLGGVDLSVVQPLYRSTLPLDQVPDKESLEALDNSKGYGQIVFSSTSWDFYRYIMGGNSVTIDFCSQPLRSSLESAHPFTRSENFISHRANDEVFDLALAARFVAWNCLSLGWTAERFEDFDTGYHTQQHGRNSGDGRTERIGKKYQWISWHTFLGFLTDNYAMRPDWDEPRSYDAPNQVDVHLHDPARWLIVSPTKKNEAANNFWRVPSLPSWPQPNLKDIQQWVGSTHDLSPVDVIMYTPALPKDWGEGVWLKLACEHIWKSHFAPGQWGLDKDFYADIWWQVIPMLIRITDLPRMLQDMQTPEAQSRLVGIGRVNPASDWHISIDQCPELKVDWDDGFCEPISDGRMAWLPVPWRDFVGKCGHPDRHDDHLPVLMPLPALFQEWGLELDLRRGVVLYQGHVVFGLAGWVHGEDVLFARQEILQQLLTASGYTLVWWLRGERRAFLNISKSHEGESAWTDYHGLAYLSGNGQVQTVWLSKEIQN